MDSSPSKISRLGSIARSLTAWLKDFVLLAVGLSILILLPKVSRFMESTTTTVANVGVAVAKIGTATVQIQQSAQDQDQRIVEIEEQFRDSIQRANTAITATTQLLITANQAIKDGQSTIPQVKAAIVNAQVALATLNEQEKKFGSVADQANKSLAYFNLNTLPKFNNEIDELHAANTQLTAILGHGNHILDKIDKDYTTKRGILSQIGHFGARFLEQVMANVVALKANGAL